MLLCQPVLDAKEGKFGVHLAEGRGCLRNCGMATAIATFRTSNFGACFGGVPLSLLLTELSYNNRLFISNKLPYCIHRTVLYLAIEHQLSQNSEQIY